MKSQLDGEIPEYSLASRRSSGGIEDAVGGDAVVDARGGRRRVLHARAAREDVGRAARSGGPATARHGRGGQGQRPDGEARDHRERARGARGGEGVAVERRGLEGRRAGQAQGDRDSAAREAEGGAVVGRRRRSPRTAASCASASSTRCSSTRARRRSTSAARAVLQKVGVDPRQRRRSADPRLGAHRSDADRREARLAVPDQLGAVDGARDHRRALPAGEGERAGRAPRGVGLRRVPSGLEQQVVGGARQEPSHRDPVGADRSRPRRSARRSWPSGAQKKPK